MDHVRGEISSNEGSRISFISMEYLDICTLVNTSKKRMHGEKFIGNILLRSTLRLGKMFMTLIVRLPYYRDQHRILFTRGKHLGLNKGINHKGEVT